MDDQTRSKLAEIYAGWKCAQEHLAQDNALHNLAPLYDSLVRHGTTKECLTVLGITQDNAEAQVKYLVGGGDEPDPNKRAILKAYVNKLDDIQHQIEELHKTISRLEFDASMDGDITWAHVGTLGHLSELLDRAITEGPHWHEQD